MRCITLRQPWAALVIYGGKDIENRAQNILGTYRGPLAIHAGQQPDLEAMAVFRDMQGVPAEAQAAMDVRGAMLGTTTVRGVHPWMPMGCCTSFWAQPRAWHLELDVNAVRPLPEPVPARGALGLWRPDRALYAALGRAGAILSATPPTTRG